MYSKLTAEGIVGAGQDCFAALQINCFAIDIKKPGLDRVQCVCAAGNGLLGQRFRQVLTDLAEHLFQFIAPLIDHFSGSTDLTSPFSDLFALEE